MKEPTPAGALPVAERLRTVRRTEPGLIGGVQALRGIAALSVAFLHIEQAAGAFVGRPGESPWPWLRLLPWEAGVDIFFVISGFVMVHASVRMFARPSAVRVFLSRRIARVVPLYWLFTTLTLAVALARPEMLNEPLGGGWDAVLASYLFIPWPRPDGFVQPLFRLGWTLNYEMLFYAVFAPFLLLKRRSATLGVIAAIAVLVAVGQMVRPANTQLGFWTDPIVAEFALGVALGGLHAEGVRLSSKARIGLVVLGLATMAAIGVDDSPSRALSYGVPAACFVAAGSLGAGWAWSTRLARAALVLGDASYALYLIHPFPMRGLREIWARLHLGGTGGIVSYVAASLILSCVLAVLVHHAVEQPLVRMARRALTV